MPTTSKVERAAVLVACLQALVAIVQAPLNTWLTLAVAVIAAAAAVGIWRRRTWSAYGYALVCAGQLALAPIVLWRGQISTSDRIALIVGIAWTLLLAWLFFRAGRSIERSGGVRGVAWPWVVGALVLTLPLVFFQPFVMPTASMENTLLVGDRILVRRLPLAAPQRGDLVVFAYPVDPKQTFVKRVAGVAGDRIRIEHKKLIRNGVPVSEPYVTRTTQYEDSYRDNFPAEPTGLAMVPALEMLDNHVVNGDVVVPVGKYFVLGDNRDASLDSRYWGFVDAKQILGKPALIYDSREIDAEAALAPGKLSMAKTRWNRLFRILN